MKATICIATLLVLCTPTWAINKCKNPNGQVIYQDAPCSADASASTIETPADRKLAIQAEKKRAKQESLEEQQRARQKISEEEQQARQESLEKIKKNAQKVLADQEAAMKALGTGWSSKIDWSEIEIPLGDSTDARLYGKTARPRGQRNASQARSQRDHAKR